MRRAYLLVVPGLCLAACSNPPSTSTSAGSGATTTTTTTTTTGGTGGAGGMTGIKDAGADAVGDASYDVQPIPPPDGSILHPCDLAGSVRFTTSGTVTVPGGGASWPSLAFLHLPPGFCAHYFGQVGNARQIRFAPGGELFVASPTQLTTGGGGNGKSAIMVLPDDDLDGVADSNIQFLGGLPSTQGLLFAGGYFYYQDGTKILRTPYATGDRMPAGPSQQIADITYYSSGLHWPKTLDMADDGTLYVGNGGDQGETCVQPHPFHGGILSIDPAGGTPNGVQLVKGLRNPISIRCAKGHDHCFALELALDYSYGQGGREKLINIHQGDDWGFPCCATHDLPYPGAMAQGMTPDCSGVAQDTNSFFIGDTPFGVDFEPGYWPAPYNGSAFVVTHGAAGSWTGARMVAIPMDGTTGLPMPSTNIYDGGNVGMIDFATGWDVASPPGPPAPRPSGRPAAVTFASDGRLFVANDYSGVIFWIAPID